MCGIFGIIAGNDAAISPAAYAEMMKELFVISESRGKEASGFAFNDGDDIAVYRTPVSASQLVKSGVFAEHLQKMLDAVPFKAGIGHARLVTNGEEYDNNNNQPVIRGGSTGIHNGIVVNVDKLWAEHPGETRQTELDSEVIMMLIDRGLKAGNGIKAAIFEMFQSIFGMTSIAIFRPEYDNLLLATNNGSIYYTTSPSRKLFVFASEHSILLKLLEQKGCSELGFGPITQLLPWQACSVDLKSAGYEIGDGREKTSGDFSNLRPREKMLNTTLLKLEEDYARGDQKHYTKFNINTFDVNIRRHAEHARERIAGVRRCTKCILPESFPFIEFDAEGVCNYCRNYTPRKHKSVTELQALADTFRKGVGSADCLVPFSGGRDSCYALHYLKKELNLNPVTYTYDWGMVTDLARRNQSRLCGALGVEHILVSADIRQKRTNIRKNVTAWLKRPNLGMVPLFMAGDKQYFYYAAKIKKELGLNATFMGENMLETTGFKTGFMGVPPAVGDHMAYSIPLLKKAKLGMFYALQHLTNPAYINRTLWDSLMAFASYYVMPHDSYYNIFEYVVWDEKTVEDTLLSQYDWEISPDTKTTWRIGDGTAAFYNYIYYVVAGFTENDTFRSNQIREGLLSREDALSRADIENLPRWESLQWYCDTIGIDLEPTLKKINSIPARY